MKITVEVDKNDRALAALGGKVLEMIGEAIAESEGDIVAIIRDALDWAGREGEKKNGKRDN